MVTLKCMKGKNFKHVYIEHWKGQLKWNLGINGPLEFATYRIQSDELKIKFREW